MMHRIVEEIWREIEYFFTSAERNFENRQKNDQKLIKFVSKAVIFFPIKIKRLLHN